MMAGKKTLKASVIIPAYNSMATIQASIEAVLGQVYDGETELIVVDDGSVDGTAGIVQHYPKARYIYQKNQGPASARNRGALEASGDILIFTDSDCCPEQGWVRGMSEAFRDESVGVAAGSYGIANPHEPLARIIHKEIRFRHLNLMSKYPKAFGSYNFAIRTELFRRLNGFNASYRRASGEDNDLSYRVLQSGLKILFLKNMCVAHYHQSKLDRYLMEQYRHGFWRARLYLDHSAMVLGDDYTFWKDILEVPLVLLHGVFLLNLSMLSMLLWGFIVFELGAGIGMVGWSIDGLLAGVVIWLRAFARTAGAVSGGVFFLQLRIIKGKKS